MWHATSCPGRCQFHSNSPFGLSTQHLALWLDSYSMIIMSIVLEHLLWIGSPCQLSTLSSATHFLVCYFKRDLGAAPLVAPLSCEFCQYHQDLHLQRSVHWHSYCQPRFSYCWKIEQSIPTALFCVIPKIVLLWNCLDSLGLKSAAIGFFPPICHIYTSMNL